ncbi:hypothetical protein H6F76_04320 [Leptolyngbya sp. FACHB-321]|uniref:serine hydrolase n=1 Tax=Leptolyngbya sp. FACHB-321 TaxID=2692807 RepID=UPI0016859CE3|nr:serine hydrolase [Leptolyngbya sp. FACHB-321]MBD2034267.1 hypothetical protein [Leptolyngbya sp. FACHB-321]
MSQAALQATSAGAATTGDQASTNMNNLLKANTERQRIAAEVIISLAKTAASAYTGGAISPDGCISSGGNHSQDGAKINYFDKTQGQIPAGNNASGAGTITPVGGSSQSGSGNANGSSNGSFNNNGTGGSYSQNLAALAATWGDSQPRSTLFDKVLAKIPDGGLGDSSTMSASSISPFATIPLTLTSLRLTQDPALLAKLSPLAAPNPDGGLAVVELSTKKMASVKGGDLALAASISKVGVAITAYRLREAVRDFAEQSSATTPAALISEIISAWKPIVSKAYKFNSDFPKLDKVLSFTPPNLTLHGLGWDIDFITTSSLTFTDVELAPRAIHCRTQLGSSERMHLMVQNSNNEAATLCTEDLGFQYIQGALEAEGFAVKGGLDLWIERAFRQSSKDWGFPPVKGSVHSATANALAMLLVALQTKSLISADASTDIVNMLKKSGSFMGEAFKASSISTTVEFVKDGLGGPGRNLFSDIDVCRKSSGKEYASVILQITEGPAFNKVAVGVDGCF